MCPTQCFLDSPSFAKLRCPASWTVYTPPLPSYPWSPSRELASPPWDCSPPLLVRRLIVIRRLIRPLRIRLPLRIPPHWVIRTPSSGLPEHTWRLIPPRSEVIISSHARAGVRPRHIQTRRRILLPEIWITHPIQIARSVDGPPTPLPLLRTVAHERAPVATRCDEHVWAFAGNGVFETAPSTCTLAVARASPVVSWAEAGGLAIASLIPASVYRVVFDKGVFTWETATRAKVVSGIVA
jgi:hypothetical protein